jgi:hypothetical protein
MNMLKTKTNTRKPWTEEQKAAARERYRESTLSDKSEGEPELTVIRISPKAARVLLNEDARHNALHGFATTPNADYDNGTRISVGVGDWQNGKSCYALTIEEGAMDLEMARVTHDQRRTAESEQALRQAEKEFKVTTHLIPCDWSGVIVEIVR